MTHRDVQDLLPLYAVDALEASERDALEGHLRECEECRAHLAQDRLAVDALSLSAPQVRPRAELKVSVMRITTEGGTSSGSGRPSPPSQAAVAQASRTRETMRYAALAAMALLALAAGIGVLRARVEVARLEAALQTWQQRAVAAEASAARAATELSTQRRAFALLSSSDLVLVRLSGVPPTAGARAQALLSTAQRTVTISVVGLPAAAPGRTYQLWVVAGPQPISAGTFAAATDGRAQLTSEIPALDAEPAAIAVTLEPEGGSPQPTGPKVLLGVPAN